MRSSEVSRHYARVLLETAVSSGDESEVLAEALDQLAELLQGSPDLAAALVSPAIPRARRARLANAVGDRLAPGSRLGRFAAVMVEHERGRELPQTAAAFREALDNHRGIVEAEVVSARPLDERSRMAVRGALAEMLGGKPRLRFRRDPSLLGGLLVRTGNRIYDASVSGELRRFSGRYGFVPQ